MRFRAPHWSDPHLTSEPKHSTHHLQTPRCLHIGQAQGVGHILSSILYPIFWPHPRAVESRREEPYQLVEHE